MIGIGSILLNYFLKYLKIRTFFLICFHIKIYVIYIALVNRFKLCRYGLDTYMINTIDIIFSFGLGF